MATRPKRPGSAHDGEVARLREETELVVTASGELAQVGARVADGARAQARAVDEAVGRVNTMTASLKETADQAVSVAGSAEELASSLNEMAASVEEVSATT